MKTDALKRAIFVVESLAHLQGRERELLPIVDEARIELANLVAAAGEDEE